MKSVEAEENDLLFSIIHPFPSIVERGCSEDRIK